MERQILHIDVNNAFLSWTALEKLKEGYNEDIRNIPSVIGGDEKQRSGIVLAKSFKAKEFGIVTGETLYSARKKCPGLKIFKGDYTKYGEYSNKLYNLLLEYTDKIERYSIDECFLDMTEYLRNDTLLNKAKEISKRVKEELGFTVNIGVANNKLLAKMASDFEKPDKVHTLFKEEIPIKMWNIPVQNLFMLGRKTAPKLNNMKIKTIGDLAKTNKNYLMRTFGKHGLLMWEYANGIDKSPVNYKYEKPKSIGNSTTLPRDLNNIEKIAEIILMLTEQVTYRLRKYKLLANVINVQLRTNQFKDFRHQKKLDIPTSSTKEIYIKAKKLLKEMYNGESIRLIGVKVDKLIEQNEIQLSLFSNEKEINKQSKLDKTIDLLKQKYGYESIKRGTTLNLKEKPHLQKTK